MKRNFILSLIALAAFFQASAYPGEGVFGAIGDSFDALITEQMQLLAIIQTLTNCCEGNIVPACTPITQSDIPLTINTPGDYCVTENLNNNSTLITIAASNVNIDLEGFVLNGNNTASQCIATNTGLSNIHICNGTITGSDLLSGNAGIVANTTENLTLNALVANTNGIFGFQLNDCTNFTINSCIASNNNQSGIYCSNSDGIIKDSILGNDNNNGCEIDNSHINFYNCTANNNTLRGFLFDSNNAAFLSGCTSNVANAYFQSTTTNALLFYNCQNTASANFVLSNNVALDMSGNTP